MLNVTISRDASGNYITIEVNDGDETQEISVKSRDDLEMLQRAIMRQLRKMDKEEMRNKRNFSD